MKFASKITAAAVAALFAPIGAHAAPLSVSTPGGIVNGISAFDWAPSNVLAVGGNSAFVNFVNSGGACLAGSCDFTVLSQGRLGGFRDASNNLITGTGLGTSYEITYEAMFGETVNFAATAPGANVATFAFNPLAPTFFRMYVDTVLDSSDLAGTGFGASGTSTLVLDGSIAPSGVFTSSFLASTAAGSIVPIGGTASTTPASWGGQLTVSGSGATSTLDLLSVTPATLDPTFFLNTLQSFLITNLSQALPFTSVDPGIDWSGVGGPADARPTVGNPALCGADVNGGTAVIAAVLTACGPNIIFQTDANGPVSAAVPEPSALALMGLGLGLIGLFSRRRRSV